MSKEEQKDVKGSVSKEVWKRLRIIAIQRELSLPDLVKEILEKFANSKRSEGMLATEEGEK